MYHMSAKDIVIYRKESDQPIFTTIEENTKEAPWGDTCKIWILVQDKSLKAGEDLLTPTKSPYQVLTNLKGVGKDEI